MATHKRRFTVRFTARRLLRTLLVVFAAWFLASGFAAWKLTHRPKAAFAEPAPLLAGGVEIVSHRLTTSDGEEIGTWFVRGRPGRGTVVLLHGNGSCRSSSPIRGLLAALAEDGHGVLAVSLRAHGDSTGTVNDIGYSARRDVVAAVEFLERERPGGRVVVCGTSLGAAAAAFASGELGGRVHGYLLDCPYLDLKTAVWNRVSARVPPGLDYVAYAGLRLWAPAFLSVPLDRIDPRGCVGDIPDDVPVVIAAAGKDRWASVAEMEALLDPVKAHGRLVVFPGARHSRLFKSDPGLYRQTLAGLLAGKVGGAEAFQ
jgi:alpha-beta hydrolase superfamily lysophospholipase